MSPFLYPHAESNRNRQNRNLLFYPLNYRGIYLQSIHFPILGNMQPDTFVKRTLNSRILPYLI